jgi:hypothetical protein
MNGKTNFQPFLPRFVCASDYEVLLTITVKRAAAARLHNELRPIHFINRRGFTSAAINLQVSPIITEL